MKIHEYQAKEVLKQFGAQVPRGEVARTPDECYEIAKKLGGLVVVKAQIHAGGRGKGGGVKVARTPEEAKAIAEKMIGMRLITHQTGPEGQEVRRVLVEEGLNIRHEYYLGLVIDRARQMPVFMASTEGGVEIEKVASETPEKIIKETIDTRVGFRPFQTNKIAYGLGLDGDRAKKAAQFMTSLYRAFEAVDGSLAEINPFIETTEGAFYALDAKINLDDNALFRHKDLLELRDIHEEDPLETRASNFGLNYIKLDGNVGCMVNGAGLAMATMDIIKLTGGNPANFLDVGGGASAEQVKNAFEILLSDLNVRAVLVNIFGGIMRCDTVASGIVEAARAIKLTTPMVIRLEGTNVDEGKRILQGSGLNFTVAEGMKDAAEKVVRLAGKA
jgi:succinyl-CoA synthetase beta subunit